MQYMAKYCSSYRGQAQQSGFGSALEATIYAMQSLQADCQAYGASDWAGYWAVQEQPSATTLGDVVQDGNIRQRG